MAVLKSDTKREKACYAVNENLAFIAQIDTFRSELPSEILFTVGFKKGKVALPLDITASEKIASVLTKYRERLVRAIQSDVKKYDIELDDKELALLSEAPSGDVLEEGDSVCADCQIDFTQAPDASDSNSSEGVDINHDYY